MSIHPAYLLVLTAALICAGVPGCSRAPRERPSPAASQPAEADITLREPPRPAATQPTPADISTAWCVTGRVTDAAGRPMPDVEVYVNCGWGTLRTTGRTTSDAQGEYVLRFGPDRRFRNDDSGLQAATVVPRRTGYFEQNLRRQGGLLMANRLPPEDERARWDGQRPIVLPGQPQRVDFVLVPAAEVRGRLVDGQGQPLSGKWVCLVGSELPPSGSVIASFKTDETGAFHMTEVPTRTLWFTDCAPHARGSNSSPFAFDRPGVYTVELVLDDAQPPQFTLRVIDRPG